MATVREIIMPRMTVLGWSQDDLAHALKRTKSRTSVILGRTPRELRPNTLHRIARAIGEEPGIFVPYILPDQESRRPDSGRRAAALASEGGNGGQEAGAGREGAGGAQSAKSGEGIQEPGARSQNGEHGTPAEKSNGQEKHTPETGKVKGKLTAI